MFITSNLPPKYFIIRLHIAMGYTMSRGGFRKGAGRPAGSINKSSSAQTERLSELAKTYTEEALETLVDVARNGRTDSARVAAANAILDRAYGKCTTAQESSVMTEFPTVIELVASKV